MVKKMIAATMICGAMVNFVACQDAEMKSQIEKILEENSSEKIEKLQKALADAQKELNSVKEELATKGDGSTTIIKKDTVDLSGIEATLAKLDSAVNELQNQPETTFSIKDIEGLLEKLNQIISAINELKGEEIINPFLFHNGHEYVDLGLSVMWATCNVGAENPWENGDKYAWGETEIKETYTKQNYIYNPSGDEKNYTKYNDAENLELEDNDDIACVKWRGNWRMPTVKEIEELRFGAYWQPTKKYKGKDVIGFIVYKIKNNKDKGFYLEPKSEETYDETDVHIFLPINASTGYYWARTRFTSDVRIACAMGLMPWFEGTPKGYMWGGTYRYNGRMVRPVCDLK